MYSEVINLAASSDRRDMMTSEFAKAGLTPIFEPAVHFREVPAEFLAQYCLPSGPWGRTRPGHMATTISHMKAWERFLATEHSFCAVFEDDVFVAEDLGAWFDDMSWWPEDADIVKLEAWRRNGSSALIEVTGNPWRGRRVSRLLTRHMGAAGYVLTRAAAEKLLNARPYDMVIDHVLFNFNASKVSGKLACYQVVPALVTQGNEVSASSRMDMADPIGRIEHVLREARRGLLELAYPVKTYWKLLSGAARFEKISYRGALDQDEQ
ncbi:glycosyltransferase family 25 protein [Nioella aestuarii]|uniref:glycosyltransferase family 25 protein n=1 Tax=Nioella aestuarii TaxID=1662864 RepID=UPI003D7F5EAE